MKCLRCSIEMNGDASFCENCLKTVGIPLNPSPYLNMQINLNAHRAQRQHLPTPETKKAKTDTGSRRGLIVAVVILSILCLALACGCVWLAREELLALLGG